MKLTLDENLGRFGGGTGRTYGLAACDKGVKGIGDDRPTIQERGLTPDYRLVPPAGA
jgi:hypothetical protein